MLENSDNIPKGGSLAAPPPNPVLGLLRKLHPRRGVTHLEGITDRLRDLKFVIWIDYKCARQLLSCTRKLQVWRMRTGIFSQAC